MHQRIRHFRLNPFLKAFQDDKEEPEIILFQLEDPPVSSALECVDVRAQCEGPQENAAFPDHRRSDHALYLVGAHGVLVPGVRPGK